MILHLGNSEELKINLNGIAYILNLLYETPIESGIKLLSSDGFILKDSNELYLTIRESE